MDFLDILTSCPLVKAIDILRDNAVEFSCLLHLSELIVSPVRFNTCSIEFLSVELIEHIRVIDKTVDTQEILRAIPVELYIMLVIKAVLTSEIRDAALSRYAGTSEKDNVVAFLYDTVQFSYIFFIHGKSSFTASLSTFL